ncbi:hypothetical protein XFEB_00463 [Xylella fastidiosa EB92.1]|nr:hypothetical protein XFEB_00463 [Xylella fastidiosa EB92.1]
MPKSVGNTYKSSRAIKHSLFPVSGLPRVMTSITTFGSARGYSSCFRCCHILQECAFFRLNIIVIPPKVVCYD